MKGWWRAMPNPHRLCFELRVMGFARRSAYLTSDLERLMGRASSAILFDGFSSADGLAKVVSCVKQRDMPTAS